MDFKDATFSEYSDAFLLYKRDEALENFDLSMKFFRSLDQAAFDESLSGLLESFPQLKLADDLKDVDGVSGVYIMVFDEHKQYYVGEANDIRMRIKQHWVRKKHFDRLVFGSRFDSVFPVDEFRALDTTRIFAAPTRAGFELEEQLTDHSDPRYSLNRIGGGEKDALGVLVSALERPRRDIVLESIAATVDEAEAGMETLKALVEQNADQGPVVLAKKLADLPSDIYCTERDDGTVFYWSYRHRMKYLLRSGDLSPVAYEQYLRLIGSEVMVIE